MKIKTWEKWYWGIDFGLIIFSIIGYYSKPENYTIEINGVKRIMTGTEAVICSLIFYVGIGGLLWLIIRFFVNRRDKK